MALWTDIIDPATLTGYVRESLSAIEARRGSLARYLPNRQVPDISVRFRAGSTGLVAEAEFRAYDAEPTVGEKPTGRRVTLELPAVGRNIPVSEYDQLRTRNASDETIRNAILDVADQVAQAVADRMERLRGTVLSTGVATITEIGAADSFGRSSSHTVTAATLWSTGTSVSRLTDLQTWADVYEDTNGVSPGVLLMPRRIFRILASGDEFRTNLIGGGDRPATPEQIAQVIEGAGLPPIEVYNRKTSSGAVLSANELLMLPEPVDVNDWNGTQLGATFWGQTLTSGEPNWQIAEQDAPGIVAGVYRNEKPPMIAEVISDAIGMPVLANADLSLKATVAA